MLADFKILIYFSTSGIPVHMEVEVKGDGGGVGVDRKRD